MTEETVTPKRGGWPKGRPRTKPTAASAAPQPAVAVAERAVKAPPRASMMDKMKARPNWDDDTAVMVGDEGSDRLAIPREMIDALARDGIALQWITRAVRGQDAPQELAKFVKGGWTPVHQSDFDGLLDGIFLPKGTDDVIGVDDCMLVARPMAIQQRARERERANARAPLKIKEAEIGHGLPVSGGDHPSARSQNRINRTMERIEVPE
jgi:hypothetical protein